VSAPLQMLQIVCPHCHALNRVPEQRLDDAPSCGLCGKALFDAQPATLDSSNFDLHAARSSLPLLVDFWAPWYGPAASWHRISRPPLRSLNRQCGRAESPRLLRRPFRLSHAAMA